MKLPVLALLLLSAAPVLAQDAPASNPALAVETVHSDALRLSLDVETINSKLGWFVAGSRREDYELETGTTPGLTRTLGFLLKARPGASPHGFGTAMRYAPAEAWRGKRVQLSARMKSQDALRLQLWLRVDGGASRVSGVAPPMLAFYNMDDRPVRGTSDWKRYQVVLDVPDGARELAFGFFLTQGRGQAWAEDFHVEEVGHEVPVSIQPPLKGPPGYDGW
jgi:hypothetical protein